jgi:hypothetical protein
MYVPDGSIQGPAGLSNVGNPWWTFQPEFIVSYLKDGWNLTANAFADFNTKNSITGDRSGDILDGLCGTLGWFVRDIGSLELRLVREKLIEHVDSRPRQLGRSTAQGKARLL